MSSSSGRTYADAIECLNSLQSNAATVAQIRESGSKFDDILMPETVDYLHRIGYKPDDLNALNVIHVTGTKGKGSVSAFCSSLLTTLAPTAKVGLYTSPHLVAVRERIRINGKPLEEDKFAKYFFEIWDRYEQNPKTQFERTPPKPAYFRYLTMMAYHVFLQEKVDATVLEVGIGGTYDTTNIVPKPFATGVTALGLDHIWILGKTIEEIAHQKGGIYKPDVPALSVEQPPNALHVLQLRAAELKASSFTVVPEHPQMKDIKLGLAGDFQRVNASLAVSLANTFLSHPQVPEVFKAHAISDVPQRPSTNSPTRMHEQDLPTILPSRLPAPVVKGLEQARWPGRCQRVQDRSRQSLTWYLDGAHTVESLACCGEWFAKVSFTSSSSPKARYLIFNCTSGRTAEALLASLKDAISAGTQVKGNSNFDHVIFCTNVTYKDGGYKSDLVSHNTEQQQVIEMTVQHELADAWKKIVSEAGQESVEVHILPTIQDAVALIDQNRKPEEGTDVLVTGSLHLIGGVFEVAKLDYAL